MQSLRTSYCSSLVAIFIASVQPQVMSRAVLLFSRNAHLQSQLYLSLSAVSFVWLGHGPVRGRLNVVVDREGNLCIKFSDCFVQKWILLHFCKQRDMTGSSKKNLPKFSDTCSIRADGLCIGSPRLVGRRKAGNANMQDFFAPRCTLRFH